MDELELLDRRFARRHAHERVEHAGTLEQLIRTGKPLRSLGVWDIEPALYALVYEHRAVVV